MTGDTAGSEAHGDPRRMSAVLLVLLALLVVAVPFAIAWWARQSSANFAENEVIGVNRLGAATLDVEVGELRAVDLDATDMAPGDAVTGSLEMRNAGDLPLRYAITATSTGGALADWLGWDLWPAPCEPGPGPDALLARGLRIGVTARPVVADRTLAVGARETLCLRATLPISAPNDLQGATTTVDLAVVAEHDLEAPQ